MSKGTRMRARQWLSAGGNAYNFGSEMARLGCSVTLVSKTSTLLLDMVRKETGGLDFSTDFVETGHDPSLTVALEFSGTRWNSALNINSPGRLLEFGSADFPLALNNKKFDIVSVFNFSNNRLGPQLAIHAFTSVRGMRLMDLPDPASDFRDAEGLRRSIEMSDIVTGSPVEVMSASRLLGKEHSSIRGSALAIAGMGPRVGVHSAALCMEAAEGSVVTVHPKALSLPSTTGAGDIWTAAYAYSILRSQEAGERLRFASIHATEALRRRAAH